jgi:hypothetical protein
MNKKYLVKPRPFPVMMDYNGLLIVLADECDLCRNDGAEDIADLLNEAYLAIKTLCADVEEREEYVRRMYASINELVAGLETHGATKWMPHRVERAVQILNELRLHDEI